MQKHAKNWVYVQATIIDTKRSRSGKVVSMGGKNSVSNYHIYQPSVSNMVKIEYEVDNMYYSTWVDAKKLKGKTSGCVAIKVLKEYPNYRRYPGESRR